MPSSPQAVRKAVFPIAGLGTRFLPATKASPKEMLPVVDKPLIQYAVEEAYQAGIRDMIFITGRTKRSIEDHFDTAYELETELDAAGKSDLLKLVQSIKPDDMRCIYTRQSRALGLGHAVLCAEHLIGDEPFAVILADDLMVGEPPIIGQLINQFKHSGGSSIIAVQEVPREHSKRYGIIGSADLSPSLIRLSSIVEKPAPEQAPSSLAVVGRYVLTPDIFPLLAQQERGSGNEIQLTDGIAHLLQQQPVFAYRYQGERYDCGSKLGFLQATLTLAQDNEEVGPEFLAWLRQQRF